MLQRKWGRWVQQTPTINNDLNPVWKEPWQLWLRTLAPRAIQRFFLAGAEPVRLQRDGPPNGSLSISGGRVKLVDSFVLHTCLHDIHDSMAHSQVMNSNMMRDDT